MGCQEDENLSELSPRASGRQSGGQAASVRKSPQTLFQFAFCQVRGDDTFATVGDTASEGLSRVSSTGDRYRDSDRRVPLGAAL